MDYSGGVRRMKEKLKKIQENIYELPKEEGMLVPGRIFISEKLLKDVEENAIKQIKNVAKLPGIQKYSIALSDIHSGYGFPIGGVAAFDLNKGVISPGGVGYDINCGIRLLATNIKLKDFLPKRKEILHDLKRTIPSGVGRGTREKKSVDDIKEVLRLGSEWALKNKMATQEDLQHTEENGRMKDANPEYVSQRAISRGVSQLGTLGAGNHFIDIQVIEEIFDEKTAKAFGLKKDNVVFLIHCGSRGLGHQVASDYIKAMEQEYGVSKFPDRELVNAPIKSDMGKKYLSAMNCAINFAFCNRQIIMHHTRELLKRYYSNVKTHLVYDVCHNIAKIEEFSMNGKKMKFCVHRKGATRCFGPGRIEIPSVYRKVGQPVLIPGSMGTPSYILVGTKKAEELAFGSTAHGAGRVRSRVAARKETKLEEVKKYLEKNDIILESGGIKGMIEESPWSYKDPIEVVDVCHSLGLGKKVAKLRPIGVMIG